MSKVFIERRSLSSEVTLSWDIAHHMYTRQIKGMSLIIAERPANVLASVRKQWIKLLHRLERERASTLDLQLRRELMGRILHVRNVIFTAKLQLEADVILATPEQSLALPPSFHTVYITYKGVDEKTIATKLVSHGLIVIYETE